MKTIKYFKDDYSYLSNFYKCNLRYKGINYNSVEHAYQSLKPTSVIEAKIIRECYHPSSAKKLGRTCSIRPDWEKVKEDIMYQLVFRKFKQNKKLRNKLFKTTGAILVEGNTWHDNEWGNCYCIHCSHIVGKNMLGKILVNVRRNLMLKCGRNDFYK